MSEVSPVPGTVDQCDAVSLSRLTGLPVTGQHLARWMLLYGNFLIKTFARTKYNPAFPKGIYVSGKV